MSLRTLAACVAVLLCAAAAGCGWPRTTEEQAEWFFGHGESWILDALEDTGADEDRIAAAEDVLEAREARIRADLDAFFRSQRALLRTLAGGAPTAELLEREAAFRDAHREALRSIGGTHEELADTVGEPAWTEARALMQERIEERLED
jgi:hypothetical protein